MDDSSFLGERWGVSWDGRGKCQLRVSVPNGVGVSTGPHFSPTHRGLGVTRCDRLDFRHYDQLRSTSRRRRLPETRDFCEECSRGPKTRRYTRGTAGHPIVVTTTVPLGFPTGSPEHSTRSVSFTESDGLLSSGAPVQSLVGHRDFTYVTSLTTLLG